MRKPRLKSGQSLLEFALLLPIFLMLIMGLFDIGRAVFYYSTLNTAVREGTRFAVVQSYCDYKSNPGACTGSILDSYPLNCNSAISLANNNICNEIRDKFFNIADLNSSTITINHLTSATADPQINIRIEFLFRPITPGLGLIGDMTMRVNSVMLMTPVAEP